VNRGIFSIPRILWTLSALAVLSACGGGSASGPTYSVGGTVSGLVGSGLQLSDNGSAALAVSGNGFFTIATSVAPGAAYSISVVTQPQNPPQTCVVHDGSGTMGSAPVTTVTVVCATNTFTVGGTVSGLQGEGLVLQNNGTDNLAVTQNGTITFSTPIAVGDPYAVTVSTQPSAPVQTCTVADGSGTMSTANVTNVAVTCANNFPAIYTVSVTVSGWAGSPLVLELNGASQLSISANGAATFATKLSSTAPYNVTVLTQPAGPPPQVCTITNGSGIIANSNVTNVQLTCVSDYSVGVTVGGLAGQGLTLLLNGADPLSITANGNATFSNLLASGASYSITIKTQPTVPTQTCTLSNAAGTVVSANVTNIAVVCPLIYVATQKGDWTWMSVIPRGSENGVYGTQGVPSPLNFPGVRYGASSWTDSSGNLWLFGGFGLSPDDDGGLAGALGDLWKYTPSAGTWEWVSGSEVTGVPAVYGTQGVPSVNNTPGARVSANTWTDKSGNFWLFGGSGANDLWEYVPSAGTWEWVSGSDTPGALGVYGAQGTPAAGNVPGARIDASSWIDATGNLWLFGGTGPGNAGNYQNNDLWEFSPASGLWTWMSGSVAGTDGSGPPGVYGTKGVASTGNVPGGRSDSVTWIDASGNLWLFGGTGTNFTTSDELNDLWEYNPSAGTWEWVGGSDTPNALGVYGTQGTPAAGNVPGARESAVSWTDAAGNFWLFGGYGFGLMIGNPGGFGFFNDLWKYNPTAGTWEWVKGSDMTTNGSGGVYGTSGVPAPANTPEGLGSAVSWIDPAGNLWLFGGEVYGIEEYFNDLWVYTPLAP
jgi:hypothetical protein